MLTAMENQPKAISSQMEDANHSQLEDAVSSQTEVESKGSKIFDSVKKAFVIVGTCLLLFAAARNSFHWHIHRIWGASGSFWQSCWDYMYLEWFNKNDFLVVGPGSFIVSTAFFWLANMFFLILDITGCPKILKKYKVQDQVEVKKSDIMKAVKRAIFNQIVVGVPFGYCAGHAMLWRGSPVGGDLPTFTWVLFEMFIFTLVEEFFFYYTHRLFHHPKLYKHIHKIHHEWTAPIGIISVYAHPLEHLLSNILPPVLGPLFMGSHIATTWLWFCLVLMSTTVAHSGYHLPLLPSPEAHDYHHLKFNQNFGVLGVLDRFHGTDTQFRASKQYQRHIMLLGLEPLNQQFPSSPKKKPE